MNVNPSIIQRSLVQFHVTPLTHQKLLTKLMGIMPTQQTHNNQPTGRGEQKGTSTIAVSYHTD